MWTIRILVVVGLFASETIAQSATLSGVVRDGSTLLPIGGAKVRLDEAGLTTATDKDGKFSLDSSDNSVLNTNDVLIVEDARYWPKRINIHEPNQAGMEVTLSAARQRLIVTTDLGGSDPDDEQSMVHLLVSANEIDIEGLICGLAWVDNKIGIEKLNRIIDAYGEVLPNLQAHAKGYPTYEYLKSIAVTGQPRARMAAVGEGKNSPGSDLIVAAVDKDDPRPIWLNAWGGANTIAQALWQVKQTRTPQDVERFIRKIRVYDILGQDDAGAWMAKTFPNLIYIRAKAIYGWAPSDEWINANVQSKGRLGAIYPNRIWATEGDSPAFMHVYCNGLNDPNEIDHGGWGGRFNRERKAGIRSMDIAVESGIDETKYDPYEMLTNTPEGIAAINRWKNAIYNNLQARMDWTLTSSYDHANHHPVAVLNGDATEQILELAPSEASVTLSAEGSHDPDDDALSYNWSVYNDPSSYKGEVPLQNADSSVVNIAIPADARGESIHFILELKDDGSPNLYAYRRVIIKAE